MKYLFLILGLLIAGCVESTNYEENGDNEMSGSNPFGPSGVGKYSVNGWSQSGPLTQNVARQNKSVTMQANFPMSGTYTAQFKITGPGGLLTNKKAEAELLWAVEGNYVRRLVSIADGVSIQGAGQSVKIAMYDVSTHAPVDPAVDGAYTVSVQVVPGTRGSTSNPPTYVNTDPKTTANTGESVFAVPDDAGVVSVAVLISPTLPAVAPIPANSIQVAQRDAIGNLLGSYDPRQYFWIPIIRGCDSLYIDNNSGESVDIQVIWGIDG